MRQVALIRGINVGRAKRIAMSDLRSLFEELGYAEVRTVLNSGNVLFTVLAGVARPTAETIEDGMSARLRVSCRITLLSAREFADVVAENPLLPVADNPSRLLVSFLRDTKALKCLDPLVKQDWTPEALALGKRVAYLWCPEGLLASPLAEAVTAALGDAVTTRNWATVRKIHAHL